LLEEVTDITMFFKQHVTVKIVCVHVATLAQAIQQAQLFFVMKHSLGWISDNVCVQLSR